MSPHEHVDALVRQWVATARVGGRPGVEELCRECPELLPEVRRRIAQLGGDAPPAVPPDGTFRAEPAAVAEGTHVEQVPSFSRVLVELGSDTPKSLGGYTLSRVIGEGGMGCVYEGLDARLNRKIAIKVLRPEIAADGHSRERFLREAKAAAALEHDHVITIYQVGEEDGVPFLVMPLLRGESLEQHLRRNGPLPIKEVLRIGREMAEGLAAAHEAGLVHRDIKPANVWLEGERGRVKILDFGLARGQQAEKDLTHSGTVVGTPAYMAPEQASGGKVDPRADLFSLGCVLYQMANGDRPFDGPNAYAILSALALHHPPSLCQTERGVPVGLSSLIDRLLSKNPADRPASTREVVTLLRRFEEEYDEKTVAPWAIPRVAPLPPNLAAGDNPWENIDDETEFDLPAQLPPGGAAPPRRPDSPPHRRRLPLTAGLGGGSLLLLFVLVRSLGGGGGETPTTDAPKADPTPEAKSPVKAEAKPKVELRPNDPRVAAELPPVPKFEFTPVPPGKSPFDRLDPKEIPPEERFDWQPKELVAVIGRHERRHWGSWLRGIYLAVSPNGRYAATCGSYDHFIYVFDLKTRERLQTLIPPTRTVAGISFSPDSESVWVSNENGIQACKVGDTRFATVPAFAATPHFRHPHLTPDRKRLLLDGPGTQVWELDGPTPTLRKTVAMPGRLGFAADGKSAYLLAYDEGQKEHFLESISLEVEDQPRKRVWTFPAGFSPDVVGRVAVAISPDGKTLAFMNKECFLYDLTASPPKEKARFNWNAGPSDLRFSADGKTLYYHGDTLRRADVSVDPPRPLGTVEISRDATVLDSPDGKTLIVGDGSVRFFDLSEDRPRELDPLSDSVVCRGPRPHLGYGKGLIVVPQARSRFWDLTGTKPALWPDAERSTIGETGNDGHAVRWLSPDGERAIVRVSREERRLATWTADGFRVADRELDRQFEDADIDWAGQVVSRRPPRRLWSVGEPREKGRPFPDSLPRGATFSLRHDGALLAARGAEGMTEFWNLTGDKPRKVSSLPGGNSLAFSPDGGYLVAWSGVHGPTRVYDLHGKLPKLLTVPGLNQADWVTFSPDGKTAYFCGESCELAGYDLPTGKKVWAGNLPGPSHWAEMAPDGRHLFLYNVNGTIYVLRFPSPPNL